MELTSTNRVLVVDDDVLLIGEYVRCLGQNFEPDFATTTLGDLEKVLFGEKTDESGAARFDVQTRNQGDGAVKAVREACRTGMPYSIVFLDVRMPPGIDGIEAARQIRAIDPNVNIVIVTGSGGTEPENLGKEIPPADRIFYFKKPFHAIECRQLAAALCGKWHSDLALRKANEELEMRVAKRTKDLHKLAYFDPVTSLPNRLQLIKELDKMMQGLNGDQQKSAVVLLDIERFSFLNETMGYEHGTELLQSIGRRLQSLMKDNNFGERTVVGRFGADEFACLVTEADGESAVQALAESVRASIEEPFIINGRDIYLKAGIGVGWHPQHGEDAKSVFRCAEAALHRSMRRLKGGITYYHSEMQNRARHKFDMEAELRHAIETGEVITYFQPQLCLKTGRLAGVEALARWTRPDGTIVPPDDFIPLSEEMGISDMLFESIMQFVCKAVARWRDDIDWDVPVSVNLSAHQLRNHNLLPLIKSILQQQNVEQKLINLELTETTLLEDLTIAKPLLNELSAYGVGIHIDDFGTGYSSLSYLAELPVQTLKIDRTFTARITESATNARVVQAIIALGKAMQLEVVAEGVETEQQLLLVNQFGCDLAQGFFIGKPMPESEFLHWCDSVDQTTGDLPELPAALAKKRQVK